MFDSLLLFAFVLGLRHGLDADHLTIINGITIHNAEEPASRWNGLFFSLGHGLMVTCCGLLLAVFSGVLHSASPFLHITEWLPIVLLLATGFAGLYSAHSKGNTYSVAGRLAARFIKGRPSKRILFFAGILFALVFDTTTQAAAWTITFTHDDKWRMALLIGAFFTIGMVLTDTATGYVFARFLQNATRKSTTVSVKALLSIIVAATSLLLGFLQLNEKFNKPVSEMEAGLFVVVICLMPYAVKEIYGSQNLAEKV